MRDSIGNNGIDFVLLRDPTMAGLEHFISDDRGTDTNNLQPRLGLAWDARGNGQLIVRGGWGMYVTRNRPWFQLRAMNQIASRTIRITNSACLRFFPDVAAVLGPQKPDGSYACEGPRQIGTLIPDDFVQPYAVSTTAGIAWQISRTTALDVNYVHSAATHQTGFTDRNLPPSGPITGVNAQPRPVRQFGQVLALENYSDSWYDALESQFRMRGSRRHSVNVAYSLSRSYLDGVDFFCQPGARSAHRMSAATTRRISGTASRSPEPSLPWDMQVGGIVRVASGPPMKVQAGVDLDGDTIAVGDLPMDIPITVGRSNIAESVRAINALRASFTTVNLKPIDASLLGSICTARSTREYRRRWRSATSTSSSLSRDSTCSITRTSGSPPNAGSNINSAAFLQRTLARDARQLQWGVRFAF